jgi:hypothetical protein
MNLVDCLQNYVGHEVSVHISISAGKSNFSGILTEAGDDFLIIKTSIKRANGSQVDSAEQIINCFCVAFLVHLTGCKKCQVEKTTKKLEKIFEDN